jgi:hypothetical protein
MTLESVLLFLTDKTLSSRFNIRKLTHLTLETQSPWGYTIPPGYPRPSNTS